MPTFPRLFGNNAAAPNKPRTHVGFAERQQQVMGSPSPFQEMVPPSQIRQNPLAGYHQIETQVPHLGSPGGLWDGGAPAGLKFSVAGNLLCIPEDDLDFQFPPENQEAMNVARLIRIIPAASPSEAREALQNNDQDLDRAASQLIDLLTQKAAMTAEAQALCYATVYRVFPMNELAMSSYPDWLKSTALNHTVAGAAALTPALQELADKQEFSGKNKLALFNSSSGRRKALLIGVSYKNTRQELQGPISDCRRIKTLLTTVLGFTDTPRTFVELSEKDENYRNPAASIFLPTKANIFSALEWLAAETRPGDALFLYFSGHGAQKKSRDGYRFESDGMDETILPLDYKTAGEIRDDDIARKFSRKLPAGVRAICMLDCCHSGTGMDLPYTCDLSTGRWKFTQQKHEFQADITLIAGCRSDQTSADLTLQVSREVKAGGAMSMAFLSALSAKPFDHTFKSLLLTMAKSMQSRGFTQVLQLSSSFKFGLSRKFRFEDIQTE